MSNHIPTTITRFDRDLRLLYIPASSFPDGIADAHNKLHSLVPFSRDRKYFGISRPEDGVIAYKASAEEMYPEESKGFDCDTLMLRQGNYIGIVIKDYRKQLHRIGETFQQILTHPGIDPEGYCVEWYENDHDVRCLVRLADN